MCVITYLIFFTYVWYIHGSGEESHDSICDGPQIVDHHLSISAQLLAVLHPDDAGLQPSIRDVNGAVEFSFMAL